MESYQHFSRIAKSYTEVRTLDLDLIFYIKNKIRNLSKIEMVEVGCGDGRYSLELIRALGNKLHLHCIDTNPEMIKYLQVLFARNKINNFKTTKASAENLPVEDNSVDCVITLNAIHHFKLSEFLEEASRILIDDGYLFIYTRLRSQNLNHIFGKYFPLFCQKETRLYELNELEDILNGISNLQIQSHELFRYKRCTDMKRLIHQAQYHHYSTFSLYSEKEFEQSLNEFKQNLKMNFKEPKNIKWTDEYSLLVINKPKKIINEPARISPQTGSNPQLSVVK